MKYSTALHEYECNHIKLGHYLRELERASKIGFTDLIEGVVAYAK